MGLAVVIVITATAAGTLLLTQNRRPMAAPTGTPPPTGAAPHTARPGQDSGQDSRQATADLSRQPVAGHAATAGTPEPVAQATAAAKATPTPPRLIAVAREPVTPETLRKISALKGVRKATVVGGGAVRMSGIAVNLLAVDTWAFRPWTPEAVAAQPEVWAALGRGEYVATASAAARLHLVLGAEYQVDGGPRLRAAASARLGIPGVDGLVSEETGRRLGLSAGGVVLVSAPADRAGALASRVRRLLGAGAQVVAIGPDGRALEHTRRTTGSTGSTGGAGGTAATTGGSWNGLVGRPATYLELYQRAARVCPGLSWTVLAAIGQVESGHGRNNGPSSAGALGPMQFMPATWRAYGLDGDGDGTADIWSPYDAVPSAAGYLCANGAGQGGAKLEKAIWFYNHSSAYVSKVLNLARAYAAAYPNTP